ncbi:hypothetical protein C8J56DRAFT_1091640 [Mycena floridula]|nr:hypothetical protein C8J56DRAFT_1091640 [Mycena floridula]
MQLFDSRASRTSPNPIQHAIHKTLISIFLTREFKYDETNRTRSTGRWYDRGFGTQAFSQAVREYVVKIIELSLWEFGSAFGAFAAAYAVAAIAYSGFDRLACCYALAVTGGLSLLTETDIQIIKYGIVYLLALTFFILMITLPDLDVQRRHLERRSILTVRCVILVGAMD